jgi:hypothetical protein
VEAQSQVTQKQTTKEVIKAGPTCEGGVCPLCTPFGLATFLVGFMVIFYSEWPVQLLGWATVALGYLHAGWLTWKGRTGT